ncbi:hypothetical protein ACQ4M3_19205 [Leptolyngbya sp. AN03gr2]|uniref:hypothetical protein n=1 Tax=Leptolyngbya sp. AN03gr2 TaxID=3423364 RepID=UPI003D31441B
MIQNRIKILIEEIGVSPYQFHIETQIKKSTLYKLRASPRRFPSAEVFDKIMTRYSVGFERIVEQIKETE